MPDITFGLRLTASDGGFTGVVRTAAEQTAALSQNAQMAKASVVELGGGTDQLSSRLQKVVDSANPLEAKLRSLKTVFEDLNKEVASGAGVGQESAIDATYAKINSEIAQTQALMARAGSAGASGFNAITTAGQGTIAMTTRAKTEFIVLANEILNGRFTRVPGSLLVMTEGLRGGVAAMLAFAGPIAAAAAGIGIFVAAAIKGAQETEEFNQALAKSGGISGQTAASMLSLSQSVSSATQTSLSGVKTLVTELVASGKIGQQSIGEVATAAAEYARATGESIAKVAPEFVKLFDDPLKGAEKLNEQMHFLSVGQLDYIQTLVQTGQEEQARLYLSDQLVEHLKNVEPVLGSLGRGWNAVKDAAGRAWDAMLGVGRPETPEQALAKAQGALDALLARQSTQGRLGQTPISDTGLPAISGVSTEELARAQQLVANAQEMLKFTNQQADAEARISQENATQQKLRDGLKTTDNERVKALQNEVDLYERQRDSLARAGADLTSVDQKIADLNKKISDILNPKVSTAGVGQVQAALAAMDREVVNAQIALDNLGKSADERTTPAMRRLADLEASPVWAKMTQAQKDHAIAAAATADVLEREAAVQSAGIAVANAFFATIGKTTEGLDKQAAKLDAEIASYQEYGDAQTGAARAAVEFQIANDKNYQTLQALAAAGSLEAQVLLSVAEATNNAARASADDVDAKTREAAAYKEAARAIDQLKKSTASLREQTQEVGKTGAAMGTYAVSLRLAAVENDAAAVAAEKFNKTIAATPSDALQSASVEIDHIKDLFSTLGTKSTFQQEMDALRDAAQETAVDIRELGNIDLTSRPLVRSVEGFYMTVKSMSFEESGQQILVPLIGAEGKLLSNLEAIQRFHETGQHLGIFGDIASANAYAQSLHEQQEEFYADAISAAQAFDKVRDAASKGGTFVVNVKPEATQFTKFLDADVKNGGEYDLAVKLGDTKQADDLFAQVTDGATYNIDVKVDSHSLDEATAAQNRFVSSLKVATAALENDGAQAEKSAAQYLNHAATVGKTREELEAMTLAQIDAKIAFLETTLALHDGEPAYEALNAQLRKTIDSFKGLRSAATDSASADAAAELKKKFDATDKKISDGLSDAVLDGINNGGKSALDDLKRMFDQLVLRPIIQAALSPISGSITQLLNGGSPSGNALAGAGNNPLLNLFGKGFGGGSDLLGSFLTSGVGQTLGLSSAVGGASGIAADAIGGIAGGTAADVALTGAGAALSAAASFIPYVGAALAAASALGLFDKKPSPAKGQFEISSGTTGFEDNAFVSSRFGNLGFNDANTQQFSGDAAKAFDQLVGGAIDAFASRFSKEQSDHFAEVLKTMTFDTFEGTFTTEDFLQKYGGQVLQQVVTAAFEVLNPALASVIANFKGTADEVAKFANSLLAINDATTKIGKDSFTANVDAALQGADQATADKVLAFVTIVQQFGNSIAGLGPKLESLDPSRMTAFVDSLGGAQKAIDALSFINANFTTSAERNAAAQRELNSDFASLHIAVPKTHEDFLNLLNSFLDGSDASNRMYASIAALAPLFVQVRGTADQAVTAVDNLTATFQQIGQQAVDKPKVDTSAVSAAEFIRQGAHNLIELAHQTTLATSGISAMAFQLQRLGTESLPQTDKGWQHLIDSIDTSTETGSKFHDTLVAMYGAWITLDNAMQQSLHDFYSDNTLFTASEQATHRRIEDVSQFNAASDALGVHITGNAAQFRQLVEQTIALHGADSEQAAILLRLLPYIDDYNAALQDQQDIIQHALNNINDQLGKFTTNLSNLGELAGQAKDFGTQLSDAVLLYGDTVTTLKAKIADALAHPTAFNQSQLAYVYQPELAAAEKALAGAKSQLAEFQDLNAQYGADKAAQLVQLEDQYAQEQKLYAGNDAALAILRDNFNASWNDIVNGVATGVNGTLDNLQRLKDGIAHYLQGLFVGNLSPLSPQQQLEAAQARYQQDLAAAHSPDEAAREAALQDITQAADSYLKLFEDANSVASQASRDLFSTITHELGDLAGTLPNGLAPPQLGEPINHPVDGSGAPTDALNAALPATGTKIVSNADLAAQVDRLAKLQAAAAAQASGDAATLIRTMQALAASQARPTNARLLAAL